MLEIRNCIMVHMSLCEARKTLPLLFLVLQLVAYGDLQIHIARSTPSNDSVPNNKEWFTSIDLRMRPRQSSDIIVLSSQSEGYWSGQWLHSRYVLVLTVNGVRSAAGWRIFQLALELVNIQQQPILRLILRWDQYRFLQRHRAENELKERSLTTLTSSPTAPLASRHLLLDLLLLTHYGTSPLPLSDHFVSMHISGTRRPFYNLISDSERAKFIHLFKYDKPVKHCVSKNYR